MRGRRQVQATMLAFVDLEERVPRNHPLRVIKQFADRALAELSPVFDEMYAAGGRPSIPPERLLKASLLISLYSVRSERAFCEQLEYNELFRWFLGMNLIEPSFDPSTFSKNRQRLLDHNVAQQFNCRAATSRVVAFGPLRWRRVVGAVQDVGAIRRTQRARCSAQSGGGGLPDSDPRGRVAAAARWRIAAQPQLERPTHVRARQFA